MNLVVGIDLGTSNTVVAVSDRLGARVVPLEQYTSVNETETLPQLPSVLYNVLPEESFLTPTSNAGWVVGAHARTRSVEVPERVITSAKSWLCHPGVDRTAAILPWVSRRDDDEEANDGARLSPVDASAAVLRQVIHGLKQAGVTLDADTTIVLTVPASFDPVARQLTSEAARRAGLNAKLLEEPQAAFYDWLHRATPQPIEQLLRLGSAARVLVVDVGGGTTDLTLLQVGPRDGLSPTELVTLPPHQRVSVERVAVGRHLLLGGDNIDLMLAHVVERKFALKKRLPPSEFAQLVAACQRAKERLLGVEPPERVPVRLIRRGAALVGNTLAAELTREEVQTLVLDGFLPVERFETPLVRRQSALLGFGLPFESDPAITRHMSQFLRENSETLPPRVDAVLFNGGFFKSPVVCARVLEVLGQWVGKGVVQLPHAEPDFAVAVGAVYHGLAIRGSGLRFGGGSARGYYIAARAEGGSDKGVCVVPKGAAEEQSFRVDALPLSLAVGKVVNFNLFANRVQKHEAGAVVDLADESFEPLPALRTKLDADGAQESVRVVLQGALTAVGTLELSCVETVPPQRTFELAFELRQAGTSETLVTRASVAVPPTNVSSASTALVSQAQELLHRVFGKGRKDVHPREVKDLWRELERLLGPRKDWDLAQNRSLADTLLPLAAGRRRSVDHERVYFSLAGFFLRPGFGHVLDPERLQLLQPLFEPGLTFANDRPTLDQFFVAWRRVAAGLDESTQNTIRQLCDPLIAPSELKLKKSKSFKAAATPLLWDLSSWLERVPAEQRGVLGQWVLERTWTTRDPQNWEWLGRIGAREPLYASAHHVVRVRQVEAWVEHLLSEPWEANHAPTQSALIGAALALARCTNDRARDIAEPLRERVASRLLSVGAPAEAVEAVQGYVPNVRARAIAYGDDLPPGLQLTEGAGT